MVVILINKLILCKDYIDLMFKSELEKFLVVIKDI